MARTPPWGLNSPPSDWTPETEWARNIARGLQESSIDPKFTDMMTVIYDGEKHVFHKVIICYQSGFFAKAIANFKEGKDSEVMLEHGDFWSLGAMFTYLYYGDYCYDDIFRMALPSMDGRKIDWANAGEATGPGAKFKELDVQYEDEEDMTAKNKAMDVHHFYDIPPLKDLAARKFKLATKTPNFCKQGFLDIVTKIYSSTLSDDRGLRDIVLARAALEIVERSATEQPDRLLEVEEAAKKIPEFAWDLIRQASRATRICINCYEVMPKEKVPKHVDGVLMCRSCCRTSRKQAQDAANAAVQAVANANNTGAAYIRMENCTACEPGRDHSNDYEDEDESW